MKKKKLFRILLCLLLISSATVKGQTLIDIATADNDVIAVIIEMPAGNTDAPSQLSSSWSVDGISPSEVGRYSYVWHESKRHWGSNPEFVLTLRHHMYLKLQEPLASGTSYNITIPGIGVREFNFDEKGTLCEAIRANQVGYFGASEIRYANFAISNGDMGTHKLSVLPAYSVLDENSTFITSGSLDYWGDDTDRTYATGEYVYRIDLSAVPDGGPYTISVEGYGCSYPFGVGADYVAQSLNVHVRGLYHQRCGIALEEPYTIYTRGECHTTVETTDAEPPGFITIRGTERSISGGYHDAGDFDRRLSHTLIPASMLCQYEAFPAGFTDGQFNIPESDNGIPDFLDEALWGLKIWEELQEEDGGIRAGTEADGHPEYGGVNAESDFRIYKTYKRYGHTTAIGAGLFAHASRLVEPYDATRAAELLTEAVAAWDYLQAHSADPDMASAHDAQRMYASLQLYLATGEEAYHTAFQTHANNCLTSGTYDPTGGNLNTMRDGAIYASYFFSYLITGMPVEQTIIDGYTQKLHSAANQMLNAVNNEPYPIGAPGSYGWGSSTNQGRYADPMVLMYRLTAESKYLDAVSQLADYTLGLNPLGRSYVTGLGANPPNNICHLDSYFTDEAGKGVVPGIVVYGPITNPGTAVHLAAVSDQVYPAFRSLPLQKRYTDGWSLIPATEFTTWETMAQNVCMFGFLNSIGGGGTLPLPDAPSGLSAESVSHQKIKLSWTDNGENESAFFIERKEGSEGTYSQVKTLPSNINTFIDIDLTEGITYHYRVCSYNGTGKSVYSEEASATTTTVTTVPEVPANLTAISVSTGQINLSWTDLSQTEDGFKLERKEGAEGSYEEIADLDQDIMNYIDTELAESTMYYYRVRSHNDIGDSEYSADVAASTKRMEKSILITVDDAPCRYNYLAGFAGGIAANSGYEFHDDESTLYMYGSAAIKADLRYILTPSTIIEFDFKGIDEGIVHGIGFDDNNSVESAKTFLAHGSDQWWGNTDFNEYKGNGWQHYTIPVGQYYTGTMTCLYFMNNDDDGKGMGYFSNIKIYNSTQLIAPSDLAGTAVSASQVDLTWTDNSEDEDGFLIERKESLGETYTLVATIGEGITSYSDIDLSSSSMYFYRVSSYNASGHSSSIESHVTTWQEAVGEAYVPDGNTVGLWHLDNDGEDASGNGFTLSLHGNAEFADTGLTWMNSPSGAALRIYELGDYASVSIPSSELWPGGKPITVEFWIYKNEWKAYSHDNYTLGGLHQSWDAYYKLFHGKWNIEPTINCNNHALVWASEITEGEWTHIAITFDGELMSYYLDRELKQGPAISNPNHRTADIVLYLGHFDGYIDEVRVSNIARTYEAGTLPADPSGLTGTVNSSSEVELAWIDHADNELGFTIERKTGIDGNFSQIAANGTNDTSYVNTGLTAATTYYYKVSAFNQAGNSLYSDIFVCTTADGALPPDAPADLVATVESSSMIDLSWTDNSEDEAWFKIERRIGEEGEYAQVGTADADETTYGSSHLEASTTYYFRICAYNEGGNSLYSNETSATTPLAAPAKLVAVMVGLDQIDLTWSYTPGAEEGLVIERKTGSDGTYEELATVDAATQSYSDTDGLEEGVKYYYRMYAFSSGGNSDYSNVSSVLLVGLPSNVVAGSEIELAIYPNPLSSSTKITYELPEAADVQLAIYDMTGRRIRTLVNEFQEADTYELTWNIDDTQGYEVADGIYLCRAVFIIQDNTYSVIRRMVVAK